MIQALSFSSDSCQCYVSSSSADQCEPTHPRPPLSVSAPSAPATMGPTRNELSPKEKEEKAGGGGEHGGAENKIAIWEGKESRGTSSPPIKHL